MEDLMDLFNGKYRKGGKRMETKSRYEVIAELEDKKRSLILERDSLDKSLKQRERDLKELNRKVEDEAQELEEFKESMEHQKTTFDELINSINESLKRFGELSSTKKS